MKMDRIERSRNAARISVSLAAELAQGLDEMVSTRGYPNRSKAIAEMIQEALITHHQAKSEGLMAGTITLIYDAEKPGLLQQLSQIQRSYIEEVISSQRILLEGHHLLEVVLVQGPVGRLHEITDCLRACKGVNTGTLSLTDKLIPQVHERS